MHVLTKQHGVVRQATHPPPLHGMVFVNLLNIAISSGRAKSKCLTIFYCKPFVDFYPSLGDFISNVRMRQFIGDISNGECKWYHQFHIRLAELNQLMPTNTFFSPTQNSLALCLMHFSLHCVCLVMSYFTLDICFNVFSFTFHRSLGDTNTFSLLKFVCFS